MKRLVIGSRESTLAVVQSMTLVNFLKERHPDWDVTLLTMKTTGDKILDRTLDKVGGKGLFVKELDLALREGRADLTVHSLKDMPMEVSGELPIVCFSAREDPRDALVLPAGETELAPGAVIGTASLRRAVQLADLFPGHEIRPVRGNLQTRLRKLDAGEYGALVLAAAGLRRLGLENRISRCFPTEEIIPAAGQGILAVQGRAGEDVGFLRDFGDAAATAAALAERSFVRALNGGCTSPVCAHARIQDGELTLRGLYYNETTRRRRIGEIRGEGARAEELGAALAARLAKEAEA